MNLKAIGLLLNIAAVATAFTAPSFHGRPTTTVYGIGDRLKNLMGRTNDENVGILEIEEIPAVASGDDAVTETLETKDEETTSETQKMMQQVKDSGVAGVISYALWEVSFDMLHPSTGLYTKHR
jgi:hypothetical protein